MRYITTSLILLFSFNTMRVAAQDKEEVQHFRLSKLPAKQMGDIERKMISGRQGTIGYFTFKKGALVPLHHHSNEQYSLIMKGSVKVSIQGKNYIVKAGEGILIPPDVPHEFVSLEDGTIDIDFFAPQRQDWIDGTDNYFKK